MVDVDAILITGAGLACGLGLDPEAAWQQVLAGRRGIGPMPAMESPLPPGKDGGQALDLPDDFAPTLPREARYLRWTILQALRNAGLDAASPYPPDRVAVMLGTTLHGMRAGGRFLRSGDASELRDFLAGDVVATAIDGLAIGGGRATTCSACSSSLGSVALAVTLLQSGAADVVIAGGYDPVSEYAWAGFNALRLVSDPPLRPFARGRCGMKLAEAYAVVVLERAAGGAARGATPLATVAGWGESADAHHLTQPHPEGTGALAAMRQAIDRARLTPGDVGLVAAHATGTPDNDAAEYTALSQLFGSRLPDVPVVAFKSHLGHTLGGAGAAELIFSALSLRDGTLPPTVLAAGETVEFDDLRLTRTAERRPTLRATLNTSLGFGGANTSVVLRGPGDPGSLLPVNRESGPERRRRGARAVVVTGVGVILPDVFDGDAFRARVLSPSHTVSRTLDLARVEALLNARRVRRMSDYVKLTLAATTLACRDAGLIDRPDLLRDTAAILGTTHGSAGFSQAYYQQIVRDGVGAANPLLFAEGVPNAGAAQLSLMLGLTGACQTIVGTRTAGLEAVRLATLRIGNGDADRVIVSAAEEDDPTVNAAYAQCGMRATGDAEAGDAVTDDAGAGFRNTAGAVTFVLESADAAAARGARVLARVTDVAAASGPRGGLVGVVVHALRGVPAADRIVAGGTGTPLDRAEALGVRRAERAEDLATLGEGVGEVFSATALVAAAAALAGDRGSFITLATDLTGLATAVRFERA